MPYDQRRRPALELHASRCSTPKAGAIGVVTNSLVAVTMTTYHFAAALVMAHQLERLGVRLGGSIRQETLMRSGGPRPAAPRHRGREVDIRRDRACRPGSRRRTRRCGDGTRRHRQPMRATNCRRHGRSRSDQRVIEVEQAEMAGGHQFGSGKGRGALADPEPAQISSGSPASAAAAKRDRAVPTARSGPRRSSSIRRHQVAPARPTSSVQHLVVEEMPRRSASHGAAARERRSSVGGTRRWAQAPRPADCAGRRAAPGRPAAAARRPASRHRPAWPRDDIRKASLLAAPIAAVAVVEDQQPGLLVELPGHRRLQDRPPPERTAQAGSGLQQMGLAAARRTHPRYSGIVGLRASRPSAPVHCALAPGTKLSRRAPAPGPRPSGTCRIVEDRSRDMRAEKVGTSSLGMKPR